MNVKMQFPNTFEEFLNEYSFIDSDKIYTNGSELIQVFRVMQGYEHFSKQIRADERNKTIDEFAQNLKLKTHMENRLIDILAEQMKGE